MDNQATVSTTIEQPVIQAAPKPRRTKLFVGLGAVVVLLAGAAFVGGQLLNKQAQSASPGGPIIMGSGPGGADASGSMSSAISVQFESAKELPATPPDVSGLFAERKDNSIFVTVGDGTFMGSVDENGTVNTQVGGNSQKLEVVVTNDTLLYKDVTEVMTNGNVQQKVAPGALDELGQNSFVTAWGERRGDRLIAKVLLYSPAFMIDAPAP
jgi:hypothetical protein